MKSCDVAIATMTRARDVDEERLIARALGRLSKHAMPIAVADGGSSRRFVDDIRQLTGLTVIRAKHDGLVGQVQASVHKAYATGREFILYTEPDKHAFFDHAIGDFVRLAPEEAGIVLAGRSAPGFKTFPPIQRVTESAANELCSSIIGTTTDYFYGPFLLHRRLATHVARAPWNLGWGWRPFLFATAHRLGYRIATIIGDYRCPSRQRMEDNRDRQHRVRQFAENARGILAVMKRRDSRSS
jgi:hypothetical protein